MKKFLLLLCSATLAVSAFAACGDKGNNSSSSSSPKRYTLTLLAEGGTGVSSTQEVVFGEEYTLTAPTRVGYTFDGWEDTSGKEYALSGTWEQRANVTLKATWTANAYELVLPAGEDAKFSDDTTSKTLTVTYDSLIPTLPIPEKEGFSFTSWTYEGKALPNLWDFTTNITVTANWVEVVQEQCTVTFVQAGEEPITKTVNKGDALTDVPPPAEKAGYSCAWDRTDFTNITENITVTAIETANVYTITFVAGEGGTVEPRTLQVTFNGAYSLPTPTKGGHIFLGWYDINEVRYTGGIWTKAGDVTLTAQWQEETQNEEPTEDKDWTDFY